MYRSCIRAHLDHRPVWRAYHSILCALFIYLFIVRYLLYFVIWLLMSFILIILYVFLLYAHIQFPQVLLFPCHLKAAMLGLCRIDGVDSAALKPNYLITLDDFKLCFFFRLHVILMLSVPPCVCASVFCTSPPSHTINMSVVHLCFSKSFYQLKLTEGFWKVLDHQGKTEIVQ